MLLVKSLNRFRPQCKDLASTTRAERCCADHAAARGFDVPTEVRQRTPKADVIINQEVTRSSLNGTVEGRLKRQTVEPSGAGVSYGVRLNDLRGHHESEAPAQLMRHGVGNQVDPGRFNRAHRNENWLPMSHCLAQTIQGRIGKEGRCDSYGSFPLTRLAGRIVGMRISFSDGRVDDNLGKIEWPWCSPNQHEATWYRIALVLARKPKSCRSLSQRAVSRQAAAGHPVAEWVRSAPKVPNSSRRRFRSIEDGERPASFPFGNRSWVNPDSSGKLPPRQPGGNARRFQPGRKGGRRRAERVVSEELDDPGYEADVRREVSILPGIDRRRVRTEPSGDVGLTQAQIHPPGADVVAERVELSRIRGILGFSGT